MKLLALKTLIIYATLLPFHSAFGQSLGKAKLTPDEYAKWSTMAQENLSPNGKWISYKLEYDSGEDTLFVKNTATLEQYYFPKGNNANFSDDDIWVTVDQENNLLVKNLITGDLKNIESGIKAHFLGAEMYMVVLLQRLDKKDLLVKDLRRGTDLKIQDVKEYVISPDKKSVAYITHNNSIKLFWIDKKIRNQSVMKANHGIRKNLVWNDTSDALTFLEKTSTRDSSLIGYKLNFLKNVKERPELFYLNPFEHGSIALGKTILYNPSFTPLSISPDSKRVFFYIKGKDRFSEVSEGEEVWNSMDKLEYQRNILEGSPDSRPKLVVWWPESNKIFQITDSIHSSGYLTPDRKTAIVYDPHQYEPQPEFVGPADFWLADLSTGMSKMILKKQSSNAERWGISPNSKYLNYHKDGNWWVYNMETDEHTLVTAHLNSREKLNYPGSEPFYYEFMGWSEDSKSLILKTHSNVWLISLDGKNQENLTDALKSTIHVGVCTNFTGEGKLLKSYDSNDITLDLSKGIVLEVLDMSDKSTGYYKWIKGEELKEMVFEKSEINRIKKSSQKNAYIWIEQKADASPQLVFLDNSLKKTILVKTNNQQKQFEWTKSKLISYQNSEGINLQGILYYPAGYMPDKKYPMIVHVYEDQSQLLHHYYNPTLYNPDGFNPNIYTTDGYFVLYPDIVYREGEPGLSAVDCVEAAVKNVINKNIVDEKRIGIIGHSFGGYEVSFIITQSKLFAAAVAGAAVTDFVLNSLSLNTAGRSEMWRYQTYQPRMGMSLYEDYSGFLENSPIFHAQNITTPLLSWTGKNDPQVDPQQSIALHMALRNLRKPNILILYPEQPHILINPEFQENLTLHVKEWFDYYLKDILFSQNSKLN